MKSIMFVKVLTCNYFTDIHAFGVIYFYCIWMNET